jgi:hypothetical protein
MSEELSPWKKYKQNLGDTRPWDVLNPNTNWVDEDIHTSRFELCKSCPEFISLTTQCKKCGCFMAVKTRIEKAECPIGKW